MKVKITHALRSLAGRTLQAALGSIGWELRRRSDRHETPATAEWLGTFLSYVRMYEKIRAVPGDVVECGVGRGRSFACFAFLAAEENAQRTLWGYDSFAGFPAPTPEDASPRNPQPGQKQSNPDDVRWMLKDSGIEENFIKNRVRLIPGFFADSLPRYAGKDIAFLHIDADLYQSYRDALTHLYPRVAHGGVILFDEYGTPQFPGATQAVREFFAGRTIPIQRDRLSGKHYLIKP